MQSHPSNHFAGQPHAIEEPKFTVVAKNEVTNS
jgi:hypothetical protein